MDVNERDKIEAALHRFGVHDGWPEERLALADKCVEQGLCEADLELLHSGITRQRVREPSSVLGALLQNAKTVQMRLKDLRLGLERRLQAGLLGPPLCTHAYVGDCDPPEERTSLARQGHLASCLRRDGRTDEEIASHLSCTIARVRESVNHYRATRQETL